MTGHTTACALLIYNRECDCGGSEPEGEAGDTIGAKEDSAPVVAGNDAEGLTRSFDQTKEGLGPC